VLGRRTSKTRSLAIGPKLFLLLVALAASSAACADRTPPTIYDVRVTASPRPDAPLGIPIELSSDEPVRLSVELLSTTGSDVPSIQKLETIDFQPVFRTEHAFPLVGLRPATSYEIRFIATDKSGNSRQAPPLIIETSDLPSDFPPIEINTSDPTRMEPGATLFSVYRWNAEGRDSTYGFLVAVNATGEPIWYYRADHPISHAIPLRNGNLLYQTTVDSISGLQVEIDLLGNVVNTWHSLALDTRVPSESFLVSVDSLHHDVVELPNGNFATLSTELRTYPDYPTSERERDAPKTTQEVVGDIIVEFGRDGTVIQQWHLLDILDPYRIGYDSLGTNYWATTYQALGKSEPNVTDWSHANALDYDPNTDSFIISARHQDAIVNIDRTGTLRWILGNHSDWNERWQDKLLDPIGELLWPYHSHGVELTPNGTILLFDNGNYRTSPFEASDPTSESYSRAVEFEVSGSAMTVVQRWAHGKHSPASFFSPFLGDADWLPTTGNILITDGARTRRPESDDTGEEQQQWARILEVTRTVPAEVVFELVIDDDTPHGWRVYRAGRWIAQPLLSNR